MVEIILASYTSNFKIHWADKKNILIEFHRFTESISIYDERTNYLKVMFIYSVWNADILKKCKIRFFCMFFYPRFLDPENYWKHVSPYWGDPYTFFKEILQDMFIRKGKFLKVLWHFGTCFNIPTYSYPN